MDNGTTAVDATSLIGGLHAHGIANVASDAPFTICGRDRPLASTKPTDPPRLFQSADPAEVRFAINVRSSRRNSYQHNFGGMLLDQEYATDRGRNASPEDI